jgi:hypothetical protein
MIEKSVLGVVGTYFKKLLRAIINVSGHRIVRTYVTLSVTRYSKERT